MNRIRNRSSNRTWMDYQSLEPRQLLSGSGQPVTVTATQIITPFDVIPRFAANPTVIAVVDGDWSNPLTWDTGIVPATDDIVSIPEGLTVQYDVFSNIELDAVEVGGVLTFDPFTDTSLWLNELTVLPMGTLTIGTATVPISESATAEIVFTDTPDANGNHFKTGSVEQPGIDPQQYGNGALIFGTIEVYGQYRTPYVRSAQDIAAGASTITLAELPADWRTGDTLVIPETSQTLKRQNFGELAETELRQLASFEADTITLSTATDFQHNGTAINPFGVQRYAHIAHLDRNVIFRSENPDGVRGHFMLTGNAQSDINSAAFIDLGRTSAASQLDNTVLESNSPVYIGQNQGGRYSLHIHHTPDGNTSVVNNVVSGGLKWGITVHDTNDNLIDGNVVYDIDGASIVTEDGDETGNVFQNNLVIKVDGGHQKDDARAGARQTHDLFGNGFVEIGADGSGFWLRSTAGTFIDNFVYDSVGYGFNFNGYYRSGLAADQIQQIELFTGNETAASKGGLWFTWSQGQADINQFYQRQTFSDFLGWNIDTEGVVAFHDGKLTFENITIIGDPMVSSLNEGSAFIPTARTNKGLMFGNPSYQNFNIIMTDIQVSGMNFGVVVPVHAGVEGAVLETATLANYVNIAFLHDIPLDNLAWSNISYLPSLVIRTGNSMPETVANIWSTLLGVVEEGVLDPDAAAGMPPALPASITLHGTELRIDGDDANDIARLSIVDQILVVDFNQSIIEIGLEFVTNIRFRGFGGDDIFENNTQLPSLAFGGEGNDTLTGGFAADNLRGGNGDDTINGGDGDDILYGNDGNDILWGNAGADRLRGGNGDDQLYAQMIDVVVDGGEGDDEIFYEDGVVYPPANHPLNVSGHSYRIHPPTAPHLDGFAEGEQRIESKPDIDLDGISIDAYDLAIEQLAFPSDELELDSLFDILPLRATRPIQK